MKTKLLSLWFLCFLSSFLMAEVHGPHVHGRAKMEMIELESGVYSLNLSLPNADFISQKKEIKVGETSLIKVSYGLFDKENISPDKIQVAEHDEHTGHFDRELIFFIDSSKPIKFLDLKEVFKAFPSLEEIDWVSVSSSNQSSGEVRPGSSKIKF